MPTNDERREVAARLRHVAKHGAPEWATSACCIAELMGEDGYPLWSGSEKLFALLADLIEPEPERTCWNDSLKRGKGVFCCSECGTHLDIADMEEEDMDVFYEPSYCPTCGLKVVRWDAN